MNKIIFLERSAKFINIILNKLHNKSYYVIPWREINNYIHHDYDQIKNPKIIVICGYDYSSSYSNYENYIESTVNRPIKLIKKIHKEIYGSGMAFISQKKPGPISNDIILDILQRIVSTHD